MHVRPPPLRSCTLMALARPGRLLGASRSSRKAHGGALWGPRPERGVGSQRWRRRRRSHSHPQSFDADKSAGHTPPATRRTNADLRRGSSALFTIEPRGDCTTQATPARAQQELAAGTSTRWGRSGRSRRDSLHSRQPSGDRDRPTLHGRAALRSRPAAAVAPGSSSYATRSPTRGTQEARLSMAAGGVRGAASRRGQPAVGPRCGTSGMPPAARAVAMHRRALPTRQLSARASWPAGGQPQAHRGVPGQGWEGWRRRRHAGPRGCRPRCRHAARDQAARDQA
eukprot:364915-Chlamydomonas_euryale.AAC.2